MNDEHLRYPIGKFAPQQAYTTQELDECILRIESLPSRLEQMIQNFTTNQLETQYRDGGWTARQVVHHVSDSHLNAYVRVKWTLTEETPAIKAYHEKLWAQTPEVKLDPALSLNLLRALHVKWVALLKSLSAEELQREYIHPDTRKNFKLATIVAMYAWHGEHHMGHLKIIADKKSN
jgi:hypothetical protein